MLENSILIFHYIDYIMTYGGITSDQVIYQ